MATIKEVITLALTNYTKHSFMCHTVEELPDVSQDDIQKTLDFIKGQLDGSFTLTSFLCDTVPEYEHLCDTAPDGYESNKPHSFRLGWWNEVIQLPEAQV